jgi:glycosyltransferase involved in cell wall biosynthesis
VIRKYAGKVNYWVSEPDNGIYHAMNKGIKQAKGDYLLFLNSGDYLVSNTILEEIMPFFKDKDLYVADICHENDVTQRRCFNLPMHLTDKQIVNQLCYFTFPHPATFFAKDFFKQYGFYKENLRIVADWKMFFDGVILGNATIEIISKVLTVFDTSGISSTSKKGDEERWQALSETPRIKELVKFYTDNAEMMNAIRMHKLTWFLQRCVFFLSRLIR